MIALRPIAVVAISLGSFAASTSAQSTLHTFVGNHDLDDFGRSVAGAGDVDGDGTPDVIVGAPWDDTAGAYAGSAYVLCGADGSVLHAWHGDSPGDWFGHAVGGAGDVDGDGFDDVIVGVPHFMVGPDEKGAARVLSGGDGSILLEWIGMKGLGYSVSGAGDTNADGVPDVIVGIAGGGGFVASGLDASKLFTLGDSSFSVSAAGDVNGDGYDDVIGGAWSFSAIFDARVFSGEDGSILYGFPIEPHSYGVVSGLGDVDGDGFDDVAVGSPYDKTIDHNRGSARVYSGVDGKLLYKWDGDAKYQKFGAAISGLGDVNGDGTPDFAIAGAGGIGPALVRVFSGSDGSVIHDFAEPMEAFGISIDGVGDVNGDGSGDLVVGAPRATNPGPGAAVVYSVCDAVGARYCDPAVPNSTGVPALARACGSSVVAQNLLTLCATELPPGQFGYFLASQTQGFVAQPGDSQGNLCLGGEIARFRKQVMSSGNGGFCIPVDLTAIPTSPPHAVAAGETWSFQAWFRDNNPTSTSNFTDGLAVMFQ